MEARAVCEILKYVIIHWKKEAAELSRKALLEGELLVSIEESTPKHRADPSHYVTTIAFAGSACGDLVPKQFLKGIQSLLSGFSGKLTWPSEEAHCAQDLAGLASFQIKIEYQLFLSLMAGNQFPKVPMWLHKNHAVDEKPPTLMADCLVIKQFLHRTSIVHPKVRFHFGGEVNGILFKETFGVEKEPVVKLLNGIGLLTSQHHYMRPGFLGAQQVCSRIHPVLGHPVLLSIPDEEANMGLLGQLTLTPAAALCPCHKLHPDQTSRISAAFEHPLTVFKDNSYLFDWKKYHLRAAPNSNISLEDDLVLPDVSYWIESHERSWPQDSDQQILLLFLMVDFQGGFPAQLTEAWGLQSLLLTHLNSILLENQSLVQGAVQTAVDQALEQHHRRVKAQQKLQASIPVAVSSILSVVAGSTRSSFRALCLQTLQAVDTQEFRRRLHEAFQMTLHQRSMCDPKKQLPEPSSSAEEREEGDESLDEALAGSCCPGEAPRPKRSCQGEGVGRKAQAASWLPLLSLGEAPQRSIGTGPTCSQARGWGGPETRGEDTLWLQEVSNLSEWLRAGPGSRPVP